METGIKDIEEIIRGIYDLPDESMTKFVGFVEENVYPKGVHLYKQNERATKIYLVKHGLVRAYARRGKKKITFWFGVDGDLAFPIESVFHEAEEYASIDLMETSTIYEIDIARLQELYKTDIHIANWGRRYVEQACIIAEKQFIDRQFKTTLERYRELLATHPDIILRVPLSIIASYLGTTPVNLSRIRAKV